MKNLRVLIQLLLIVLLLIAIALQLSLRKNLVTDAGNALVQAALNDFYLSSAEREVQKELKVAESGQTEHEPQLVQKPAEDNQSPALDDPKDSQPQDELSGQEDSPSNLQQVALLDSVASSNSTLLSETIPNLSSNLWCIDLVRRCMKFKDEQRPSSKQGTPSNTMALAAPVLKGGYRNQYMRFVALVANALSQGHDLLLESIKWHEKATHNGVPFELLWDVDEWNHHEKLPKLVHFDPTLHSQWNNQTTAFAGTCPTVITWFQAPHRTSVLAEVKAMTHPYAMGGARSGQPGNLWDYYRQRDKYGTQIQVHNSKNSISLQQLEEWILRAMKPSNTVKDLIQSLKPQGKPYIALHPRIEPEMLQHTHCQAEKIRSLPEILNQVVDYPQFQKYSSLFVAVAMPQMTAKVTRPHQMKWFKDHQINLETLNKTFAEGLERPGGAGHLDVWTAGEASLEERKVNVCMLQLLASIVNMELAIEADVYIGTAVSTWSNSVWKIRHWRGKPNYEFTKQGIKRVEGLPPAFRC